MESLRKMLPLDECLDLFPDLAAKLPDINHALRNINFGKMDYLPYDEAIPGYHLAMRTDIIPQGVGKPPSMGHWQLEVSRAEFPYLLLLQGKAQKGTELAEIVFPCGTAPGSERFFDSTSLNGSNESSG